MRLPECSDISTCNYLPTFISRDLSKADADTSVILNLAGKPGDRWAYLRKKAGREESPDTVVFAFRACDESFRGRTPQTAGQRAW